MFETLKLLQKEHITSIKELQKSPSRHLKNITRIQRGKKTLGYFLDELAFGSLIEDMEAMQSETFIKSIEKTRKQKKEYSLQEVKQRYGV